MSSCELCTFTVERFEVYYFDSYATDGLRLAWEDNPEKMVDGLLILPASTFLNNRIQWLDTNTSELQIDKTITKVEIRAFSTTGSPNGLAGPLPQYLRPVFIAGQGDTHTWQPPTAPEGDAVANWSQWFDITSDTNAPGTWGWADVVALDMDTWSTRAASGDPQALRCFKVEIRVTWTESVELQVPRNIDGGLLKKIDIFNLWETKVKTRDSGLNSQAYQLQGLASPGIQTVFQTIHEWIENHDKVTINCYGDCANGIYIIKNFSTNSTRNPTDYLWVLDLEKVTDI